MTKDYDAGMRVAQEVAQINREGWHQQEKLGPIPHVTGFLNFALFRALPIATALYIGGTYVFPALGGGLEFLLQHNGVAGLIAERLGSPSLTQLQTLATSLQGSPDNPLTNLVQHAISPTLNKLP